MSSRTAKCPDCGGTVPARSLSCPSCGAMLASVSGAAARAIAGVAVAAAVGHVRETGPSAMAPARIQTQSLPDHSLDAPAPSPADRGPATPLEPSSIRQTQVDASASMDVAPTDAMAAASIAAEGGYLPPGTPVAATLPGPVPAEPALPAPPPADVAADATPGEPETMATLDLSRLDQALGYATAAGSGLIAFGMLMPWSQVVIGASGVEGLFNTWGLAGTGHVLVLVAALAVLLLSVLPNRIPLAVRSGLAGLILGVFSLGLAWPYVIGPLGAGIGVLVVTVGALTLTATGITSAWRERHAAVERPV